MQKIEPALRDKLEAYVRYLKHEGTINDQYGLDDLQVKILKEVLFAWNNNRVFRVSDILALKHIASPATLHAGLNKLVGKELLYLRLIPENRSKFVEISKQGWERYTALSGLLNPPLESISMPEKKDSI